MASGWVSRKPRSQKAAGPLLHWGENKIRVNASNKTDAPRTKICWHALHIFTHGYAEKPVNHFVGAAVSLLGGGSHLSLSRCKCYELRELLFLPLHISGQLSVDSRGTRTRTAESASQCLFFALLDLRCNRCLFFLLNSPGICGNIIDYKSLWKDPLLCLIANTVVSSRKGLISRTAWELMPLQV